MTKKSSSQLQNHSKGSRNVSQLTHHKSLISTSAAPDQNATSKIKRLNSLNQLSSLNQTTADVTNNMLNKKSLNNTNQAIALSNSKKHPPQSTANIHHSGLLAAEEAPTSASAMKSRQILDASDYGPTASMSPIGAH